MPRPQRLHLSGVFAALSHGSEPDRKDRADPMTLPCARADRIRQDSSVGVVQTGRGVEGRALRALHAIVRSPGIGVSRLARDMSIQQPTASQVVKVLASRRWVDVVRDSGDRRAVRIYASADGLAVLHRRMAELSDAVDASAPWPGAPGE